TAPINYAMGTIHFYQEVETKPTPRVTIIDFCFISNPGYGCIETLPYTKTGVNETMRSMAPGGDWYQRNQINFTRKIGSVELVIKDPATYTNGRPGGDCVPSKMRFVATIVSPGGTYQKPAPGPGFGGGSSGDGGSTSPADAASVAPDDGAPAADAATTPEPDAAVAPPTKADAAPSTTPPPSKPDASTSKPPTTEPPTSEPDPTPPPRKASSGCTVGAGSGAGVAGLLMVLLVVARRRRR